MCCCLTEFLHPENEVCAKVIFSQTSVILSREGKGAWVVGGMHFSVCVCMCVCGGLCMARGMSGRVMCVTGRGACVRNAGGQYASYGNAFLLKLFLHVAFIFRKSKMSLVHVHVRKYIFQNDTDLVMYSGADPGFYVSVANTVFYQIKKSETRFSFCDNDCSLSQMIHGFASISYFDWCNS